MTLTPSERAAVDQATAHLSDLETMLLAKLAEAQTIAIAIADTLDGDPRVDLDVIRALQREFAERHGPAE